MHLSSLGNSESATVGQEISSWTQIGIFRDLWYVLLFTTIKFRLQMMQALVRAYHEI